MTKEQAIEQLEQSIDRWYEFWSGASSTIDATSFVKDGMLDNVVLDGNSKTLKSTFNTDSGKQQIDVPLGSLVDIYTVSATHLISEKDIEAIETLIKIAKNSK